MGKKHCNIGLRRTNKRQTWLKVQPMLTLYLRVEASSVAAESQDVGEKQHNINVQVESGKDVLFRTDLHSLATDQQLRVKSNVLHAEGK